MEKLDLRIVFDEDGWYVDGPTDHAALKDKGRLMLSITKDGSVDAWSARKFPLAITRLVEILNNSSATKEEKDVIIEAILG